MMLNGLLLAFLAAGKSFAEVALPPRLATSVTDLSTQISQPVAATNGNDAFSLLDIVLVASVDGKLHALNRTSGNPVWSMAASSGTEPATLGPLVRTEYQNIDLDLLDDDSVHQEIYVVEPQTGDIFVMSSPESPLQRLPFSMPQLVDMSPFSFSSDDDRRVFIGKKETSLLLIELETGRVKATLNSECPWDPFQDLAEPAEPEMDLDELDGTKPPKIALKPTEIYIGRTDYTIAIHTRPSRPSATKRPIQRLSFSVYGPNNEDLTLQTLYRHTADDTYIQPLPTGEILSFKATNEQVPAPEVASRPQMLWGQAFPTPIVAVLDVLRAPQRSNPFVLLQPRLHLRDILPNLDLQSVVMRDRLDAAFVGMVEETGSLFAMSPQNFPLVIFGDRGWGRVLDSLGADDVDSRADLPGNLDALTRRAKERRLRKMCREGSTDRRCLTGVRKLESSSESRLSRLLDGTPYAALPPSRDPILEENATHNISLHSNGSRVPSASEQLILLDLERDPSVGHGSTSLGYTASMQVLSALALIATALLAIIAWLMVKRRREVDTVIQGSAVAEKREMVGEGEDSAILNALVSDSSARPLYIADRGKHDMDRISALAQPSAASKSSEKVNFIENTEVNIPTMSVQELDKDVNEGLDTEKEYDTPATPEKRKGLRRKRGKKKRGGPGNGSATDAEADKEENPIVPTIVDDAGDPKAGNDKGQDGRNAVSPSFLVVPSQPVSTPVVPSLVVSDTVLGFGSHGTVVYKGSLQGRAVAVKRLLQDFVTLASREVSILQESDDHPNVIRYYYQETQANFLYIALELCPASLADIVERPDDHRDIAITFNPKRALRQITAGLRHLHALKIIHRDIKPQNILISHSKRGVGETAGHRMLISDFGLCKKLEIDQTSFLPTAHGAMAAGTVGWRAPEILRGEVKLDDAGGDESQSSRGSVGSANTSTPTGKPTRLTKSVDIFALGCLYYYVLTNGGHPFGDRFEREVNILKNAKSLEGLERFGEEGSEGTDLINCMLNPEAYDRPDTSTCLLHPYFWDSGKRLTFLQDASDRFEIMCRDPRDPNLVLLETGAINVVGNDWHSRLDKLFIENLGKFRKYDGRCVQDLLRALRNKKHHYQDLPENVKRLLGSMPEGFLAYFTRRFPLLFLHVHAVVAASSLRHESIFRNYFELAD